MRLTAQRCWCRREKNGTTGSSWLQRCGRRGSGAGFDRIKTFLLRNLDLTARPSCPTVDMAARSLVQIMSRSETRQAAPPFREFFRVCMKGDTHAREEITIAGASGFGL